MQTCPALVSQSTGWGRPLLTSSLCFWEGSGSDSPPCRGVGLAEGLHNATVFIYLFSMGVVSGLSPPHLSALSPRWSRDPSSMPASWFFPADKAPPETCPGCPGTDSPVNVSSPSCPSPVLGGWACGKWSQSLGPQQSPGSPPGRVSCTELVSCGAGPVRVWVLCQEVGCWCEGCAAAPALCSGERERTDKTL